MKSFIRYIVCCFISMLTCYISFSQSIKTVITGFTNTEENDYPIQLVISKGYVHYHSADGEKSFVTKTINGYFRFEIMLDKPIDFKLILFTGRGVLKLGDAIWSGEYIPYYYLLMPGDSIHVDASSLKFVFSGVGVEKFYYREELAKIFFNIKQEIFKSSEDKQFDLWDTQLDTGMALLERWRNKMSVITYLRLKADLLGAIEGWGKMHVAALTYGRVSAKEEMRAKKRYEKVMRPKYTLVPNDTVALSDLYLRYLEEKFSMEFQVENFFFKNRIINQEEYITLYYSYLQKKCQQEKCGNSASEQLIGNMLTFYMQMAGINKAMDSCVKDYLVYAKNIESKDYVNNIYTTLTKSLTKGTPVPKMPLNDTLNSYVSLEKYKGKIMVLDFWFTGCTGCKIMAPWMDKVKDHFKNNNNILFINISIDKDMNTWMTSVRKGIYGKGGISLRAGVQGSEHPMIKSFQINAYPRLIIYNKKGELFDASAPSPSKDDKGLPLILQIEAALRNI